MRHVELEVMLVAGAVHMEQPLLMFVLEVVPMACWCAAE